MAEPISVPAGADGDASSTSLSTLLSASETGSNSTVMETITYGSLTLTCTSEPSTPPEEPIQPPPTMAVGPAVGLAIGAATAGALLALAVLTLYSGRKRRNNSSEPGGFKNPSSRSPKLQTLTTIKCLNNLEQPMSNDRMETCLNNLQKNIRDFVDNCFEPGAVTIGVQEDANIRAVAGDPPQGFSTWSDALSKPAWNGTIIKALLAQALFKAIDPLSDGDMTLLPLDFKGAYYRSLHANVRRTTHGEHATSNDSQLLSWWRQISGHFLLKHNYLDQSQIQAAVATLDAALARLRPRHESRYLENLKDLITNTAGLGLRLFQQPYMWQAIWEPPSSHSGRRLVVVFPGLQFLSKGQPSSDGQKHELEDSVKYNVVTKGL